MSSLAAHTPSAAPAKPPYPPSPVIARVEFDFTTHQRHALGSDNGKSYGILSVGGVLYIWNFTPKWLSVDGTQFTMIFTGKNTNDSWNTVAGRFIRK